MNKIIKYKNNIIFILFIILSISLIINSITDFNDGLISFENNINKIEIFIFINIWAIHYIFKIISRLNISKKKLYKSFIYFSEDIVQILKKAYQKDNYVGTLNYN